MILLIDIGNTRLASTMSGAGSLGDVVSFSHQDAISRSQLDEHWGDLDRPEQVYASCVGHEDLWSSVSAWISDNWNIQVKRVVPRQSAYGIQLAYAEPQKFGSDRWAAMVAARHLLCNDRKLCIVDSGSAMTVDLLDETGCHKGGYILPGLDMMVASMVAQTAKIEIELHKEISLEPGRNTTECVYHGVLLSQVALLEYLYHHGYHDAVWVVTGGNGVLLKKQLPFEVIHQPGLVLEGLSVIAEHGISAC